MKMKNDELSELLTKKEMEILKLVAYGKHSNEIATKLNLSTEAIKIYINSILKKMSVSNRVQMAIKAIREDPF